MADRTLVKSCLKGDEEAWVELWTRYGPVVKAVARRVGCDAEEAKDVLQRVALAALQGLDRLRDPETFGGWLAGTARFQALEVIRKRRPGEQLFPDTAIHEPDPEESIQRDRDVVILRRALLDLDERCRRLIQSLDLEGPTGQLSRRGESRRSGAVVHRADPAKVFESLEKNRGEDVSSAAPRAHYW